MQQSSKLFCLAPWTHAFIGPNGERRICCQSSEKSQQTYSDLHSFWNGKRLKSVRASLLIGKVPPECNRCAEQVYSADTYNHIFNNKYNSLATSIIKNTSSDGHTSLKPINFDYRLTNQCNLKCRMCSELYSSAILQEKKIFNIATMPMNFSAEDVRSAHQELITALSNDQIDELYWAGGEPLLSSFHWEFMQLTIQQDKAKNISCVYNTNLTTLTYKGQHLYHDILKYFKTSFIHCSMDAYEDHAEYLRTGLQWNVWKKNILELKKLTSNNAHQHITIQATLTLPGLFSLQKLINFANEHKIIIELSLVDDQNKPQLLSPLALPKHILHPILQDLVNNTFMHLSPYTLTAFNYLKSLLLLPTYQEIFEERWETQFHIQKTELLKLEKIRTHPLNLDKIFALDSRVYKWWSTDIIE